MGDANRPLPPVPPAWHNPKVARGNAEWIEFREPSPPGQEDVPGAGEAEEQVRGLIDEFNNLVAEGAYEELPPYFVEHQQEAAKRLVVTQGKLTGKLKELAELLKERMPDQSDVIDELINPQIERFSPELDIDWIEVVSETKAVAKRMVPAVVASAPDVAVPINFLLLKDEWYVEWPMLEMSALLATTLEMALRQYEMMVQGLQAGMMSPGAVIQQLALAARTLGQPLPAGLDLTSLAEPEEEAPEEKAPEEEREAPRRPPRPSG